MTKGIYSVFMILLLALSVFAKGNNSTIKGKIITQDNLPASSANVKIKGTNLGATSNSAGNYEITGVAAGSYILLVSSVGYEGTEININISQGQTLTAPVIKLKERTVQVSEITIAGEKESYKSDSLSASLRLNTELLDIPQNIQVVSKKIIEDQQILI